MKRFNLLLLTFFTIGFLACGGGENTAEDSALENPESSTENPQEEAKEESTPEKRVICAINDQELTKLYMNLEIDGDKVRGVLDYNTPKAGFTVYSYYNVEGTKAGDKLNLNLTLAESDEPVGVGGTHEEVWILNEAEGKITADFDALIPDVPIVDCPSDPNLSHEIDTSPVNALPEDAQMTEGTLVQMEQGDYFYLIVRTETEDLSIMVLETDEVFEQIYEDPEAFEGKGIRVYWVESQEDIPEAGGVITVKKYLSAEILE